MWRGQGIYCGDNIGLFFVALGIRNCTWQLFAPAAPATQVQTTLVKIIGHSGDISPTGRLVVKYFVLIYLDGYRYHWFLLKIGELNQMRVYVCVILVNIWKNRGIKSKCCGNPQSLVVLGVRPSWQGPFSIISLPRPIHCKLIPLVASSYTLMPIF